MENMINKIPTIGFGTSRITKQEDIDIAIGAALKYGYYNFDTAQIYNNEYQIGNAFKKYNINREEYFITSKVWVRNFRYHTYRSVQESLRRLQIKYIDLMLLHANSGYEDNLIAYKELIRARNDGLISHIGVSNWSEQDIDKIYQALGEYPYVNQIIASPINRMLQLEKYCKDKNIILTAYSTIRCYYNPSDFYGKYNELTNEQKLIINNIAHNHSKLPSQVILKWALQHNYCIIPKSSKPKNIKNNIDLKDIQLDKNEMKFIDGISNFGDKEFLETMKKWQSFTFLTDEEYKRGLLYKDNFNPADYPFN